MKQVRRPRRLRHDGSPRFGAAPLIGPSLQAEARSRSTRQIAISGCRVTPTRIDAPSLTCRRAEPLRRTPAHGPPIVADGGMGALVSDAVPRLRCPEEANLRAPESVVALHASFIRAGAELIETNTFGANRPQARRPLPRGRPRADQLDGVRLAREAREVSGADVFIAGSIGPLGEASASSGRAEPLFARAGAGARGPRRRPVHGRDVLRPGRARRRDRGRARRSRRCRSWR